MSRRLALAGGSALLVVALGLVAFWWLWGRDRTPIVTSPPDALAVPDPGEVRLYFPGGDDLLHEERREISADAAGEDRVRLVVEALLEGPMAEDLFDALPSGFEVSVGGLFLAPDGTLFLDLASTSASIDGIGSKAELLSVYSMVNSIVLNETGARAVVLLWNGRQPLTLAGHVDLARPLTANRDLLGGQVRTGLETQARW